MKFQKGTSGNPAGRPANSTTAALVRKDITEALPLIMKQVVNQAITGDLTACKILLDKICPNLRPQALPINVAVGDTLAATGDNVIAETMSGRVPPDIGAMLITALSNQGKLVELQELEARISALEEAQQ